MLLRDHSENITVGGGFYRIDLTVFSEFRPKSSFTIPLWFLIYILAYFSGVWNGKSTKLQKNIVKILSTNAHTEPLFKQLKFLKIIDIFKLQEF